MTKRNSTPAAVATVATPAAVATVATPAATPAGAPGKLADPVTCAARIREYAAGVDLATDPGKASKVAKRLNKAAEHQCPTGGRLHPRRSRYHYWVGADVVAFLARQS